MLDIERDPAAQGFTNGTYDVVIASRVLYGTKSISRTLNNVRSLLKPGGTLLLMEDVKYQMETQFVNGLLPDWWLADEPERKIDPLLNTSTWDRYLLNAGFTGISLELHDCESTEFYTSVTMMSTVPMPLPPRLCVESENMVIVTNREAGPPPAGWLKSLQNSMAAGTEGVEKNPPIVQDLESASATAAWYANKICNLRWRDGRTYFVRSRFSVS